MKYKEWLHDWLELYEKESVKPRTYKQYEDVINKRLIPALGDYEMEDLSPIILQRYIVDLSQKGNTKTGKGLAPNSVNCIILVLHSSLSMAYVLGLTKEIHVDKIKRPKTSEKPIDNQTATWYHKYAFSCNGGQGNAEERPEHRIRGLAERVIPCRTWRSLFFFVVTNITSLFPENP